MLLLFHIIKLHFFFGGGGGVDKYKYKVEKETNHDLSPMMVGDVRGRRSSIELTVFGIGKSSC